MSASLADHRGGGRHRPG